MAQLVTDIETCIRRGKLFRSKLKALVPDNAPLAFDAKTICAKSLSGEIG